MNKREYLSQKRFEKFQLSVEFQNASAAKRIELYEKFRRRILNYEERIQKYLNDDNYIVTETIKGFTAKKK